MPRCAAVRDRRRGGPRPNLSERPRRWKGCRPTLFMNCLATAGAGGANLYCCFSVAVKRNNLKTSSSNLHGLFRSGQSPYLAEVPAVRAPTSLRPTPSSPGACAADRASIRSKVRTDGNSFSRWLNRSARDACRESRQTYHSVSRRSCVVHLDCQRPRDPSREESILLFRYCWGHGVAKCPAYDQSFRQQQLGADLLSHRSHPCPRCRTDLTESLRGHLYATREWHGREEEVRKRLEELAARCRLDLSTMPP